MPIYEFHCDDCKQDFECLLLGSEKVEGCPDCKGRNVHRLLSACSFVSKGKGGETVSSSASSCGGCTASSCSNCSH